MQMAVLSYLLVQSGTKTEKEIATLACTGIFAHALTQKTVNYDILQIS